MSLEQWGLAVAVIAFIATVIIGVIQIMKSGAAVRNEAKGNESTFMQAGRDLITHKEDKGGGREQQGGGK